MVRADDVLAAWIAIIASQIRWNVARGELRRTFVIAITVFFGTLAVVLLHLNYAFAVWNGSGRACRDTRISDSTHITP